jgi:hypothetical protein
MAWTQTPTKFLHRCITPRQPLGGRFRSSKKAAVKELHDDLRRHTEQLVDVDQPAEWIEWAFRLGAGLTSEPAPDGTEWLIERTPRT